MKHHEPTPQELQRESDRIALTEGIADEALNVLKRHFRFDLPAFQFRDGTQPLHVDGQTLALMAAARDGAREVIQYIEAVRKLPPLQIYPQDTL